MDMAPLLAAQLDDLPGGAPTDGTCLARVLRYSQHVTQQHPRISTDLVPELPRAQKSAANRVLFQILLLGLKEVWTEISVDIRQGQSAIDLYRYFGTH